jgi:hypothetical protein
MDSDDSEAILEKLDKGIFLMISARSKLAKFVNRQNGSEVEHKKTDVNKSE